MSQKGAKLTYTASLDAGLHMTQDPDNFTVGDTVRLVHFGVSLTGTVRKTFPHDSGGGWWWVLVGDLRT